MYKILTFHYATNYGAVLQAFALQSYIIQQQKECSIANYIPSYIRNDLFPKNINELMKFPFTYRFTKSKQSKFNEFRKKYLLITEFDQNSSDIYIVGSDQVWNPDLTNGIDETYFLSFTKNRQRYSYAASFGRNEIEDTYYSNIVNYLEKFTAISVRESCGKEILVNMSKDIKVVIDPVFLFDKDFYINKFYLKKLGTKKFCLVYTLENSVDEVNTLIETYHKKGMRIISIGSFKKIYKSDQHIRDAGPLDFLNLIYNADVIISNSFHTIAFSIIFQKPFEFIRLKNGRNSRIDELLDLLENDRLNERIDISKQYLEHILNEGKYIE